MSGQWWNDDEVPEEHHAPQADVPPTPPPAPPGFEQPTMTHVPPPVAAAPSSGGPRVPLGMAIAAVLALIGGLLVFTTLSGGDSTETVATGEIFLERADEAGDDPFFDEYEELVSFDPADVTPPGATPTPTTSPAAEANAEAVPLSNAEILALSFKGGEPGLYGGTGDNATCNKAALVAFLETSPAKASAWAGAQGIAVADIADFVDGLTTVALLTDTRVTNHGFKNGVANPIQSVLQAGMAVMIDDTGTPRVKCGCGNPLNRPVAQSRTVVLKGDPWQGFDQGKIATIEPEAAVVDTFVLRDSQSGNAVERPAGTSGEADVVTSLAAPRPTDELAAGAAAAAADSLTGSDQTIDPTPRSSVVSEDNAQNSTTTRPPDTTTTETAPASTLPGRTYCEKYANYVSENSGAEIGSDEDFLRFVQRAVADLTNNSPPEIRSDWDIVNAAVASATVATMDDFEGSSQYNASLGVVLDHAFDVCGFEIR